MTVIVVAYCQRAKIQAQLPKAPPSTMFNAVQFDTRQIIACVRCIQQKHFTQESVRFVEKWQGEMSECNTFAESIFRQPANNIGDQLQLAEIPNQIASSGRNFGQFIVKSLSKGSCKNL